MLDNLDEAVPLDSSTNDMPVVDAVVEPVEPEKVEPEKEEATDSTVDSTAEQPKKSKGVQKRIDELTKQAREAERREQLALDRETKLMSMLEGKQEPKKDLEAPDRNNYETLEDYLKAHETFVVERAERTVADKIEAKLAEERTKTEQATQQAEFSKVVQTFEASKAKAIEKYDDYLEVAEAADVPVPQHVAFVIMNSAEGPEILYHLGKNPDEAQRIASLHPVLAAREIGLLEARLSGQTKPKVSNAPSPITPVGSKENVNTPLEELSMEEYVRRRNAKN